MGWTHGTVVEEVRKVIAEHAALPTELTLASELVGDLGIDSLGVMEVVADIEDRFELTIADDELRQVATLGDVVAAIEARLRVDGRLADGGGTSA